MPIFASAPNYEFVMPASPKGVMLIALPRNRISPSHRVAPLRVADLEIDALDAHVRQGTREIRLSPNEHILLYTLAARPGAVVTYRELTDALGPAGSEIRNNSLARHLSSLRRKLRDDPDRPRYIETVRTIGFRFIAAPQT
jgi:two-component system, OmpR family, KDP operon response regulator KdpE